ncbi:MAG: hypothetical protein IJR63_10390 [Synergistaceae bacterium]|nr:hypothetical protein [Synergistaceae bacterium]
MQRVRNNIRKARKHTQKARKDIRRLRESRRRDYYDRPLNPATIRAIEEVRRYEEFLKAWEASQEDNSIE